MTSQSVLRHRPAFTAAQAEDIARRFWNIDVKATTLPGERDQNFLLDGNGVARSVLKIANGLDERPLVELQIEAASRIAASPGAGDAPAAIPSTDGDPIIELPGNGDGTWLVRRVHWVDGQPLAAVRYRSKSLLRAIGLRLAHTDRALAGLDHPAAHRPFDWDPRTALNLVRDVETLIGDATLRRTVRDIADLFEQTVQPGLDALPRAIIHADANDHNVIVGPADRRTGERVVTGLIDFGDILHTCRAAEPAIAAAYAMLDAADPLEIARLIVGGYHAALPLDDNEIDALWGLACMRLCVSACMAARQQAERPDDEYLGISQSAVARTLPRLAELPPRLAAAHLRHACGLEPVVASPRVRQWLDGGYGPFGRIIDDIRREDTVVLDLGVDSPLVHGNARLNDALPLGRRIAALLADAGAMVGVARWDEARRLDTGEACTTFAGDSRTVHLGEDVYVAEGTPVLAPLAGTVVAFNDNDAAQDCGPVVILRHETGDGTTFHTLYGHLSRSSLVGLFEGREIGRGERIGTVGGVEENGGWTPHLHFQLIVDLLGLCTDFPGFCRASEREIWKSFSPDPDTILGLLAPDDAAGPPDRAATVERRRMHIAPNLSIAYREPLFAVRGWMQYLFDDTGRRFLDGYNNVPHVGHCHPAVVEAAARQMALLETNTRYVNRLLGRYAERLAATLPDPLDVVFLVNSASEANELAVRLARTRTRRRSMIVLEHAYHGHTGTLIDLSPYKHAGPGGGGAPDWVHVAPIPDTYRGRFRAPDPRSGAKYAHELGEVVERISAAGGPPCAFIAETLPSVAGQVIPPDDYFAAAYAHVRAAGGLCIADEVQTCHGRTGSHLYAFERYGVVPDIVVLGKPIGNGHPIGAVITTREIADAFDNGMEFFSTFGGNTVSCAVGLAVLEVMEREKLMAHAAAVGGELLEQLRPLADRYPIVGDVRGAGLFIGVELVRDRQTLEPAGDEAGFVCDRMRDRGVLIGTDGPTHNVLKIRPPMPFDPGNAQTLVAALDESLADIPGPD